MKNKLALAALTATIVLVPAVLTFAVSHRHPTSPSAPHHVLIHATSTPSTSPKFQNHLTGTLSAFATSTATSTGSITIRTHTGRNSTTMTISLQKHAEIHRNGRSAELTDLRAGDTIAVAVERGEGNSLTAQAISASAATASSTPHAMRTTRARSGSVAKDLFGLTASSTWLQK